jgi:hypothetical protein
MAGGVLGIYLPAVCGVVTGWDWMLWPQVPQITHLFSPTECITAEQGLKALRPASTAPVSFSQMMRKYTSTPILPSPAWKLIRLQWKD